MEKTSGLRKIMYSAIAVVGLATILVSKIAVGINEADIAIKRADHAAKKAEWRDLDYQKRISRLRDEAVNYREEIAGLQSEVGRLGDENARLADQGAILKEKNKSIGIAYARKLFELRDQASALGRLVESNKFLTQPKWAQLVADESGRTNLQVFTYDRKGYELKGKNNGVTWERVRPSPEGEAYSAKFDK